LGNIFGFSTGYVKLGNELNQEVYYALWPNKNGKVNAPLIVMNIGGPGVCTVTEMFVANGPLSGTRADHIWSKDPWHSLAEIGDLLYPDIPAGNGFSLIDTNDITVEQMIKGNRLFFDKLANEHPEILNKNRQIILFGTSYGVSIFSNIGKYLKEQGYNVKALFDSPWVDSISAAKLFPKIMKKYDIIEDNELFKKWENESKHC